MDINGYLCSIFWIAVIYVKRIDKKSILFLTKKGGKHPPDIESILSKETEPIRPGRTHSHKIKPKSVVYFAYRFN